MEAYRQGHGAYPVEVTPVLGSEAALPVLLQLRRDFPIIFNNQDFYRRREATYHFQFYVPDGSIGYHYEYCCGSQGTWTVTD